MLKIGFHSTVPLVMLNLSVVNARWCMFSCNSIGVFSFLDRNWLNLSAKIISLPGLYRSV